MSGGTDDPLFESKHADLPLRDRMPEYLAVFGVGFVAAALVGLLVGLVSSTGVPSGIGYTLIMLGVVFLLAGGASGGGYTNMSMGAIGQLFGGRRPDDDVDDERARGGTARIDPTERLRRGLRPEANPRAFWQVIGGFGYIALGVAVVELLT